VAQKLQSDWDRLHPNSTDVSDADLLEKANIDAQLETLKEAMKSYEDPGPIYDCM
jgi:hypothetical protein